MGDGGGADCYDRGGREGGHVVHIKSDRAACLSNWMAGRYLCSIVGINPLQSDRFCGSYVSQFKLNKWLKMTRCHAADRESGEL